MASQVNDMARLLDDGWKIALFKNELGSYTARALRPTHESPEGVINDVIQVDEVVPPLALYGLIKKVVTERVIG